MFLIYLALYFFNSMHPKTATSFEQYVSNFLVKKDFQGAVCIAKEGNIVFSRGFGLANAEHNILNSSKTVFRIGSLTKQFTAVAILQLQEQGLLNVHDPIHNFLPDYPNKSAITIHHLLTHTSGIPSITDFPNLSQIQRHPSTPTKVMRYFQDHPLEFSPGTECKYSDSGYIVLGAIVEKVSGIPYEEYVREHFFKPLKMHCSYFDHNQTIIPMRASGYGVNENNELVNAEFIEMSFPHGAGSLASTVEDLYLWDRALKRHALLSSSSSDLLFSVHAASDNNQISYGYGFFVDPELRSIGHLGSIEGFHAASYRYLDEDVTIIVLTNRENISAVSLQKELILITRKFFSSQISFWRC